MPELIVKLLPYYIAAVIVFIAVSTIVGYKLVQHVLAQKGGLDPFLVEEARGRREIAVIEYVLQRYKTANEHEREILVTQLPRSAQKLVR